MSSSTLMFACFMLLIFVTTLVVTGEPCADKPLWAKECVNLKKTFGRKVCVSRNYHMRRIARTKCQGTCGFCPQGNRRAHAPPIKCSRTLYGCCWDRVTPAVGPRDLGCPACIDRHRSVCKLFRWMCARNTPNSEYIQLNCPVRCGFCNPSQYVATGKEESLHAIISRMRWKEYRKSRRVKRG